MKRMMALEQAIQALPPVLYLGLSGLAFAISLHAPKQGQRLALLPLILIPAFLSLSAVLHVPFASGVSLVWGQALTGYVLHTISTLHLEEIPPPCPSGSDPATLGFNTCFDFGYFRRIWLNPRLIRRIQPIRPRRSGRRSSLAGYSLYYNSPSFSYTTSFKQISPLRYLTKLSLTSCRMMLLHINNPSGVL